MAELKTNGATIVEILGSEYRLVGEDSSYLKQLAQYVDSQLRACSEKGMVYSSGRLGILTCLNIADQLFRLKDEYMGLASNLVDNITKILDKIDKILEDIEQDNTTPTEVISTKR